MGSKEIKVVAQIAPVEKGSRVIKAVTTEETTELFPNIKGLYDMMSNDSTKRVLETIAASGLAIITLVEATKASFPIIFGKILTDSPPWPSLNEFPILQQISTFVESPLGAGLLSAVGSIYLGKSFLSGRARIKALSDEMGKKEISETDLNQAS